MRSAPLLIALLASFAVPAGTAFSAMPGDPVEQGERAREIRALEKDIAKLEKRYDKQIKRCQGDEYNRPDARACDTARVIYQDVQQLKKRLVTLSADQARTDVTPAGSPRASAGR